jgi:hypothetical protein
MTYVHPATTHLVLSPSSWHQEEVPTSSRPVVLLAVVFLCSTAAQAQLGPLRKRLGLNRAPLSDERVASGLREALQVGTGNAVQLTGRPDGYFRNEAIKILMPERLRTIEKGLRRVGYGRQVDDFILSMNRAAERAAPLAKDIFWNAIGQLTFDDARHILSGGDNAATEYFRRKTSDELTVAFRPVVEQAMNEVGATRRYEELTRRAQSVPFVHIQTLDIGAYVVAQALDGLFHVLSEEETKIRTDPAARVTSLLKEVFR